ncbi:hypothetical protein PRIPAC_83354 [Pristionchus pacificus]|uniref:Uncharacterized protein n=1 Tax=Pristionchus pacificus TaxID=54126 RepID=A0A454XS43_PRIPA|nr:hypothetical protein PRIPAC_83354 [Pristionchus pacificus]|eukprot:PDM67186.1 hypothetical protein PRIPAC_48603 [Pristionchus pacificus]
MILGLAEFRSHSSSQNLLDGGYQGTSRMRNWPLFLFLTGLVFFFYVFYVYQAVSTELSMKKEQLELQFRQQRILKEEIIDLKADLEKSRVAESTSKTEAESANSRYEECQSTLRSIKLRSDTLTDEKTAADSAAKERLRELEETKNKMTELERNASSLQALYDAQQSVVSQLNTTINMLQTELASHKKDGGETATVAAAPAAGAAATTTASSAAVVVGGGVGKKPADLGELIKQEGAADKPAVDAAHDEPLKEEERAAVENGEKPDPSGKKPEDELKGAAVMKDDVEGAKEDKEEMKGGDAPGRPGDRVKMEEELMVAEQNQQVDQQKLVGEKKEGREEQAGAVQGGDYVDKDDAELEGEVKEDGALDAPEAEKQ